MSEPEPQEMIYLVEVADRHGEMHRYEVGPAGLLIGRSPTCDVLRPSSGLASRRAALIALSGTADCQIQRRPHRATTTIKVDQRWGQRSSARNRSIAYAGAASPSGGGPRACPLR